jgi:hypothetical protein
MARKTAKRNSQQQRRWQPLRPAVSANPEIYDQFGMRLPDQAYVNDLYSVFVRELGHGALHISFHRHNRAAIRDWRHFQAIKNEVAGPERLAVEVFPPESQLTDTSNEYHLWVFPPDWERDWPFLLPVQGWMTEVTTQAENEAEYGRTASRQRDWQPGIPTGKGRE